MSPEPAADLRAELLDDFFAECDELLSSARVGLAALEPDIATGKPDAAQLEALFRSVHSLKGNSGIVGLRIAEELAHATEGLLRRLTRREVTLEAEHYDLLAAALQRLEQVITAQRLSHVLPATADLLLQLQPYNLAAESAVAAGEPGGPPAETPPKPAASPGARSGWRFIFTPSATLDARGVNINAVRARLSALGEIVSAVPTISPGGGISFAFILALREPPTDLASWEADGVRLQPAESSLPAPSGGTAGDGAAGFFIAPSHIVRVDLSRLDDLMRITGEMVISRSRLEERLGKVTGDRAALQEVNLALGRSLRELREAITRVRLVPIGEIFSRMPFVVRDLARETGKRVRLVLEGEQTEIDKYLVERLKEPLLHLVRNAISHGVETPEGRNAKAKPAEATLVLRATAVGQAVVLQIRDDGQGIDVARVRHRAAQAGIPISATPTDHEILDVICRAGFSTREAADHASGRGVGMAVVHTTVRELGGTLALESQPGAGTQFTLRLPLTLSIAETFIVSAAGQTCAVPQGFVEEVIQIDEPRVRTIQQVEVISYRDGILPLVRLRTLFGAARPDSAQATVLVLSSERGLAGLVVDRVHGQREVVVRSMPDPLIQVPGISGATELGDGKPVLILDPALMTSGAVRPRAGGAGPPSLLESKAL